MDYELPRRDCHTAPSQEIDKGRIARLRKLAQQAREEELNIRGAGSRRYAEIVEQRAASGLGPWHVLPASLHPHSSLEIKEA